jgi:hypothetical protein
MKMVLDFVKSNWILLTCGLVTVLAIGGGVLGMMNTGVIDEMNKVKQAANDIASLKSDPQNSDTINAEKERGQKFDEEYASVVSAAESINERKPLLDGVFPRPSSRDLPYRFKEAYDKKLAELPSIMSAGDLPTDQEAQDEQELIGEAARRKAAEQGTDEPNKPATPPPPTSPPTPTARGNQPPVATDVRSASTSATDEARHRAAAKKARAIRMYASPKSSFHVSPIAASESVPEPREMWYAQMGVWIQEDLAKAITRVNDAAAAKLAPRDVNVSTMPIKRLESVRLGGYVTSSGTLVPFPVTATGSTGGDKSGAPGASFTGRKSDAQFDVVRFTLSVIVDERELLKLIDAITRQNFYQLVGLEFTQVESSDPAGYMYGEAPLVRAGLDFEGYFARKLFKELMPEPVLKELSPPEGGQKPVPPGRGR